MKCRDLPSGKSLGELPDAGAYLGTFLELRGSTEDRFAIVPWTKCHSSAPVGRFL
jgi:hypothetical protein